LGAFETADTGLARGGGSVKKPPAAFDFFILGSMNLVNKPNGGQKVNQLQPELSTPVFPKGFAR
jgi:hypothetical protein